MIVDSNLASIIMPVYNGEKYLRQAIESVLAQTYSRWELIVIDDGSTDNTSNIVKSYNEPRIRYIFQENRGQAAALNHGLGLAEGGFITTLDADDWYPPNSLEERVSFLTKNLNFGAVYGDGFYCKESGENLLRFSEHMPNGISGDVYDMLIVSPFYGTGATVLIRKSVLDQYNIRYDESIIWCQDWDFYIRLASITTFGYVSSVTIQYRLHADGMTIAVPKGKRLDSVVRTRHKILASPRYKDVSDDQKSAFFYDFLTKDLKDNIEGQRSVFKSEEFGELPGNQQSRLLRITATSCILQEKHAELAREWLQRAWSKAPFDLKTAVIAALSFISVGVAKSFIVFWQRNQIENEDLSPFDLALKSKEHGD